VTLKILGRRRVLVGALAAATLMGVTAASVASASGTTATQRVHPGSISSFRLGAPTAVYVANNSADVTNNSTTLKTIPGMVVTFKVRHRARVLMHFTDEAGCRGKIAGDWCVVEIVVNNVEAAPGAGRDYAIDTSDGSGGFKWIGAGLNRNRIVRPGTYTVRVVFAPAFSGNTAWSGENSLEVWVF